MAHSALVNRQSLSFEQESKRELARAVAMGGKREPQAFGGWTFAWGPGRHSQRKTKNTRPAKRNICRCYIPRRIEINVTPTGASGPFIGLDARRKLNTPKAESVNGRQIVEAQACGAIAQAPPQGANTESAAASGSADTKKKEDGVGVTTLSTSTLPNSGATATESSGASSELSVRL